MSCVVFRLLCCIQYLVISFTTEIINILSCGLKTSVPHKRAEAKQLQHSQEQERMVVFADLSHDMCQPLAKKSSPAARNTTRGASLDKPGHYHTSAKQTQVIIYWTELCTGVSHQAVATPCHRSEPPQVYMFYRNSINTLQQLTSVLVFLLSSRVTVSCHSRTPTSTRSCPLPST